MNRHLLTIGKYLLVLFLFTITSASTPKTTQLKKVVAAADEQTDWHNLRRLKINGQGWKDLEHPYDRLPGRIKSEIPGAVWNLSHNSAGLNVRFTSNTQRIRVKWYLRYDNNLSHMAATAVKGVDLYVKGPKGWAWAGVGKPANKANEKIKINDELLVSNMTAGAKDFLLYLPLYDGVDSVFIGVDKGATFAPVPEENLKKIVFYGTSITQGACATRAGMAYPAILGRTLNRETINLGFSGNGKLDLPLARLLAEVDAGLYVLDCLPNLQPEDVTPKTEAFVKELRNRKPGTPILLVENILYDHAWIDTRVGKLVKDKNINLQVAYKNLKAAGIKDLYYLENKNLTGPDGENTVDGVHLTDLGFSRLADGMAKAISKIQKKYK
ncbi:hydrolase [Adhaeribacter aerolatus]|uniref:Hydrolase n=1 Tax=Adhaeribacter aerolatus TaxID=670289 RepID=A0A512AS56_9BACT|nr:SGNH/GDSL hydrolase family protein [Adhaeribacter aerolatus]GEO02530.1 hydrolase [Adhaeribacter aerolatus]